MDDTEAIRKILNTAAASRRAHFTRQMIAAVGCVVQMGPFQGMRMLEETSWGEVGDLAPHILGTYEMDLHAALERAIAAKPELVVNVGCADGFYAVGLARRLPGVPVHAFDLNPEAQAACRKAAELNGVSEQIQIYGACRPKQLKALVKGKRALVVLDCEGGEKELLTADTAPTLAHSILIVECHDVFDRSITPTISPLFFSSHQVELVREGPRDPSSLPGLRKLTSLDRLLLVCEFRPEVMHWMLCWPNP